jgi:hypothetical protein
MTTVTQRGDCLRVFRGYRNDITRRLESPMHEGSELLVEGTRILVDES